MIKKKTLFKNIFIFLFLVPMLVLSLFCLVPKKQNLNVSAADQVLTPYSFVGSNIIVPLTMETPSSGYDSTCFLSVTLSFTYSNGSLSYNISGSYMSTQLNVNVSVNSTNTVFGTPYSYNIYSNGYHVHFYVNRSPDFITQNINRVQFFHVQDGGGYNNHVRYYDTSNNYIDFSFNTWDVAPSSFVPFNFVDRTYYLNLLQMDNNTYYDAGYTDGYNRGVADGSDSGYTDGYNAGQIIGYDNGYSAGLVAGGDHTFMSLIGAVIDAPVSAFTSLLNFELLGVNLLGFITGLLTLAIIIFIIKLCLGGK